MPETSRRVLHFRIGYAIFGIVVGISAFVSWLIVFDTSVASGHTMAVAGLSAVFAAWNMAAHLMHLRDYWRMWIKGLKYFTTAAIIFTLLSLAAFITYIALAASKHQSLTADSFYITAVWSFICLKWSVMLFLHTRTYRSEFADLSALLEF